jgi:glutathione peroxidase
MKIIITLILIMFSFFSKGNAQYDQLATDFSFNRVDGKSINLLDHKGKVIIVVNVASRCGFTNQYEGLQSLWRSYKDKGVLVVGVPSNNFRQEPGSNKEILDFCEATFGIDFPITEKLNVLGSNAHPFFIWAKKNYGSGAVPKWNFHKIIIGKNGKVVETLASITKPSSKKFISVVEREIRN